MRPESDALGELPAKGRGRSSNRLRWWGFRLFALSLGLGLGLLVAELALRLMGLGARLPVEFHPYRGMAYRSNASFDYAGEGSRQVIHFNADGFRDGDWQRPKGPGVYRIAVLGDSYVEAPQVAESDRFTERLEQELNRDSAPHSRSVEVMNFGISTYGTMQELQTLKHCVWQYQPDLVVVCLLTGNDFQNNCRELFDEQGKPYLEWRANGFVESFPKSLDEARMRNDSLWGHSRLLAMKSKFDYHRRMERKRAREARVYRFPNGPEAQGVEAGLDLAIYAPPASAPWEHAWAITEELLRRINLECKGHETPWLLVTLSNGIQVHPDSTLRETFRKAIGHASLFYPEDRLSLVAQRDGYEVLCLAPRLLRVAEAERTLLHGFPNMQPGYGHWNECGHAVVARELAAHLGDRIRAVRPSS